MLCYIMLVFIMLNNAMLNVIILSVIMPSVIALIVVAPAWMHLKCWKNFTAKSFQLKLEKNFKLERFCSKQNFQSSHFHFNLFCSYNIKLAVLGTGLETGLNLFKQVL